MSARPAAPTAAEPQRAPASKTAPPAPQPAAPAASEAVEGAVPFVARRTDAIPAIAAATPPPNGPGVVNPAMLRFLQRTAGNDAVAQLVRRSRPMPIAQRQAAQDAPPPPPSAGPEAPREPDRATTTSPPEPEGGEPAETPDPDAERVMAEAAADTPTLAPSEVTGEVAEQLAERYRELAEGEAVERDRSADPLLRPEIVAAVRAITPDALPDRIPAQRRPASANPERPAVQRRPATARRGPAATAQREPAATAQRQAGPIPTIHFKYPLSTRKRIKIGGGAMATGYLKTALTVDMPAIEGTAKPPPHLASNKDFTFEKGKGLIPRADIVHHSEEVTNSLLGTFKVEAKSGLEVRKDKVELNAVTVTFDGVEPSSFVQPQLAFDLVNWEKGEWPMFLDFNIGSTFYKKVNTKVKGWDFEAKIALPVKIHFSLNEEKAAQWVVRTIGPRLIPALPAAAAIGAPLMAGAVCLALWIDAVQTGREIAQSVDKAYFNSTGYADGFIAAANGRDFSGGNEGAKRGVADANAVRNRWTSGGLSPGLVDQMIAGNLKGQLNHSAIGKKAWDHFSSQAIAEYRARHKVDAWCYDKGLPNDQRLLERVLRAAGSRFS